MGLDDLPPPDTPTDPWSLTLSHIYVCHWSLPWSRPSAFPEPSAGAALPAGGGGEGLSFFLYCLTWSDRIQRLTARGGGLHRHGAVPGSTPGPFKICSPWQQSVKVHMYVLCKSMTYVMSENG